MNDGRVTSWFCNSDCAFHHSLNSIRVTSTSFHFCMPYHQHNHFSFTFIHILLFPINFNISGLCSAEGESCSTFLCFCCSFCDTLIQPLVELIQSPCPYHTRRLLHDVWHRTAYHHTNQFHKRFTPLSPSPLIDCMAKESRANLAGAGCLWASFEVVWRPWAGTAFRRGRGLEPQRRTWEGSVCPNAARAEHCHQDLGALASFIETRPFPLELVSENACFVWAVALFFLSVCSVSKQVYVISTRAGARRVCGMEGGICWEVVHP